MKINGIEFTGAREEVLVIPRGGHEVVFKAVCIPDMSVFDEISPQPKPPQKMIKGGVQVAQLDDEKYLNALDEWSTLKTAWMVIESLKATDGLEWSTVTEDPATWPNYRDDLAKSGFSDSELGSIIRLVSEANGLNQAKINEATARFLAGREAAQNGQ